MVRSWKKLGEILVEKGLISAQLLGKYLEEQKRTGEFLGELLLRKKVITPQQLTEVLSLQFNMPTVSIKDSYIDWSLVEKVSSSLILDYKCMPLREERDTVVVAITNPLDMKVMEKIEEEFKARKVKKVLTSTEDMEEAIKRYRQYLQRKINQLLK